MRNLSNNTTLLQTHISPLFKVCLSRWFSQGLHFVRGQWITLLMIFVFIGRSLGCLCLCKMSLWSWWWVRRSYGGTPSKINIQNLKIPPKRKKDKHLDTNHKFLLLPADSFQRCRVIRFGAGWELWIRWDDLFPSNEDWQPQRWGRTLSVTQEIRQPSELRLVGLGFEVWEFRKLEFLRVSRVWLQMDEIFI